jgi:cytochrome c biogenesis protein CcmG, thiol:disulfide interchange protein DsbE
MTENSSTADTMQAVETPSTTEAAPTDRRITLWQLLIIGVLVVFLGFLVVGLNRENKSDWRASGIAPDFTFTTFDGKTMRLADLKGKGVVVNFWASWCVPCKQEAQLLEHAWQREKNNNIVFLGLDYLDQENFAKAYIEQYGISYPSGPDLQSAAARRYGITGVPETFFIAPDGTIKSYLLKQIATEAELNQYLATIRPK